MEKKKIGLIITTVVMITLLSFNGKAQEKKWHYSVNLSIAHYERNGRMVTNVNGEKYPCRYPFDPGIEFIVGYDIGKNISLNTGLSYQYGRIANHIQTYRRFRFGEISVPVFFSWKLGTISKYQIALNTGATFGQFLHISYYDLGELYRWRKYDHHELDYYSTSSFFIDSYFGLKVKRSRWSMEPFIKPRIKENWLKHERTNTYWGVKMGFEI
ncbi:hypothetical protein EMN47_10105 [Prolixibacteraceae bacterium JC049]|nr:hypothetical protein [Prolixibacteraceae bacterium JC049]